ncbi:MAG: putative DNA binding domain-containing protein [Planctomycetota bacterium]|nr:putative DNA binding domain-containing protein [Planctomycetota bacterium]
MDFHSLSQLVAAGESDTVEFKKSTGQLTRSGETLCGFLNGRGGRVVIGVSPSGEIPGQQVSDKTLQDVAAMLQRFEPPAPVSIHRIAMADSEREVIVLDATGMDEAKPFTFNGRPYQRVETTTSVMPQKVYEDLLLHRVHVQKRWETSTANIQLEDLDLEEILRTVRLGIQAGRLPESTSTDPEDILTRLKLKRDGHLLNAAMVLFGKEFMPDYPQCILRLARFKGITKNEFLDNRQEFGNAFQLLEEARLFLQRHLPVAGRIIPGVLERKDEPLFPYAALREALVNAFCHRDYSIQGGSISLAIYDDRLELWSTGILPLGIAVEDLKRDHTSVLRNPLIAGTFYRRGLVENWGRGTQNIVELCVKAGHPEPEFLEQAGAVGIRFLPSGYIAPYRVTQDLSETHRQILHFLSSGKASLSKIHEHFADDIELRQLRVEVYKLRDFGLIDFEGKGRGTQWFLLHGKDNWTELDRIGQDWTD